MSGLGNFLLQYQLFGNMSALVVAWVLGAFLVALRIVAFYLTNTHQNDWAGLCIRGANILAEFLGGIAFYPIASMMGSFVSCRHLNEAGQLVPMQECWSGSNLAVPIVTVLSFLLILTIASVRQLFMVETIPFESNLLSKAHGRIDAAEYLLFGIGIFLIPALSGQVYQDNVRWVFEICILVVTAFVAVLYSLYPPYYFVFAQTFKTGISGLLAWAAFVRLFLRLFKSQGFEAVVLLYLSGFLILISGLWLSGYRRKTLMDTPVAKLNNEYEAEIKVRMLLQKSNSFWSSLSDFTSDAKPDLTGEVYMEANSIYLEALSKFQRSSFIYEAYSNFLFSKRNYNYCLTVISKARSAASQDWDVLFSLFKKSRLIEKIFANQKGATEIRNYFTFLDLSRATEAAQKRFLTKKIALFAELRKPVPNVSKIQRHANTINQSLDEIQRNYRRMFNINPSAKVLRRYATFVSNIVGHSQMMRTIVEHADRIETSDKEKLDLGSRINSQTALFDDKNAVFVLSTTEGHLGEILEVSLGAVDMFGFTASSELIGMNISQLMPSPYAELHDGFLKKYMEYGFSSILDISRKVTARDKMGFVFEVMLYVRQIVDKRGEILFVGIMSKSADQPEFVIIDSQGFLSSVSINALNLFQEREIALNPEAMPQRLRLIHISQWIPTWGKSRHIYLKEQGWTTVLNGHQMHIKAHDLSKYGSNYTVIELWVNRLNMPLTANGSSRGSDIIASNPRLMQPRASAELGPVTNVLSEVSAALEATKDVLPQQSSDSNPDMDAKSDASSSHHGPKPFLARRSTAESELEEILLQNTAMNMIGKFEALVNEYKLSKMTRGDINVGRTRWMMRWAVLLIVVWNIISNVYINTLVNELALNVGVLRHGGIRSFGLLHSMNAIRTLQLLDGCGVPGSDPAFCQIVSSWKISDYSASSIRTSLKAIANEIVTSQSLLILDMMHLRAGSAEAKSVVVDTEEKDIVLNRLRGFTSTRSRLANQIDATDILVANVVRLGLSSAHFPLRLFSINFTTDDFNTDFSINRAAFLVLNNSLTVNYHLDVGNEAHNQYYQTLAKQEHFAMLLMSVLPPVIILVLLVLILAPTIRKFVAWEVNLMDTFLAIPKSLLQWWHNSMLKALEREAREEEEALGAELYLLMQNNDEKASTEPSSKPKDEAVKEMARHENAKSRIKKRHQLTSDTEAFRAFGANTLFIRMLVCCLILSLVPLISLSILVSLDHTKEASYQTKWAGEIVSNLFKSHYFLREAFLHASKSDPYVKKDYYIDQATLALDDLSAAHTRAVSGDASLGVDGLSSIPYFQEVLVGNACGVVDENIAKNFNLPQTCQDFQQGRLKYGTSGATLSFQQLSRAILATLKVSNTMANASAIADHIRELQSTAYHLAVIIRSTRPKLLQSIRRFQLWWILLLRPFRSLFRLSSVDTCT